jgi:PKD repeat protein
MKQKNNKFHLFLLYLLLSIGCMQGVYASVFPSPLLSNKNSELANHKINSKVSNKYAAPCILGKLVVCQGQTITYTSTTIGVGYTYLWTAIGGTITPTGSTASVVWSAPGSGSVSLIVKDVMGNVVSSCSIIITIQATPNPIISASFTPSCDGTKPGNHNPAVNIQKPDSCLRACELSKVIYSTPLNAGNTYTWNVIGASSYVAAGNTVTVTWGPIGNGIIGVTETTSGGCTKYIEICVKIIAKPIANFTTLPAPVGGVVNICLNQTIQFIDQSTGTFASSIVDWYWTFGDGSTSTDQNPTHAYSSPGSYNVWLFVKNECDCKDSMRIRVIVDPLQGPDINCASAICEGGSTSYSTTATGCGTYNWSVVGGIITSSMPYGSTINVNWTTTTGSGIVTLSVSGCAPAYCTEPTSIIIPIISSTATIFGPNVACLNSTNTYSLTNMPGCTYNWTVTGGTIIGGQSTSEITVDWPNAGTVGTVQVTYFNPILNCGGQGTLNVILRPTFAINGNTKVCKSNTIPEVYSTTPAAGIFTWTIKDNLGAVVFGPSNSNTYSVNWSTLPVGTYQVIATNTTNYCNSPQSIFVSVYASPPNPTLIVGPMVVCPNTNYNYSSTPTSVDYYLAWNIVGGTPSNTVGNSASITWGAAPPYTINLYQVNIANPNCSSAVFTQTINPVSIIPPTINGPTTTCNNSIRNYSATPTIASSYTWSISPSTSGSIISGQGTPNVQVQWNNTTVATNLIVNATYCTGSVITTQAITLTAPPVPIINNTPTLCSGQSITFSSPTIASGYSWNFGDGSPLASGASVAHTYPAIGNYTVVLTVTNPGGCTGTSSVGKNLLILQAPSANLTTASPNAFCPGVPISTTMVVNTNLGNTFSWVGGASAGLTVASYTATAAGTYYVNVTSPNGCTAQSNAISVVALASCPTCTFVTPPTVAIVASAPSCNVVNFTGTLSAGATNPKWNFADPSSGVNNISTLSNPSHTFSQSGYYLVSYSADFPAVGGGICRKSVTKTVIIPAVADFEWKINGCTATGYIYDFTDKSNFVSPYSISARSWSFAGGVPLTSILTNPIGVILTPGVHLVSLTITSAGGAPAPTICTKTYAITVPPLPSAAFTSSGSLCLGSQVAFNSTGTNLTNWLWNFGDGASSLLNPTTRTYTGTGSKTVTLTVSNIYGCSRTSSQIITITPNTLSTSITAAGPTTFCQGGSVALNSITAGGTIPYAYLWSNTFATTPNIIANASGNYYVQVTDNLGCKKTSNTIAVAVKPLPIPVITGNLNYCIGTTVNLNANQGASSIYQWYVNGVAFGSNSPSLNYYASTVGVLNIYVSITGPNGCTGVSAPVNVTVYPSPAAPSVSSSPGGILCAGTPITLTATGAGAGSTYLWSNGATSGSTIVNTGGIYSANIISPFGCVSPNSSISVTDLPDLSNFMTGCYEICDSVNGGNGITWYGPVGPYTYQWNLNGVPIFGATNANITIPTTAPGNYTLTITSSGCSVTSETISITFKNCTLCHTSGQITNIKCKNLDLGSGNFIYSVNFSFSWPGSSGSIMTVTSPDGAIASLSTTTVNAGVNNISLLFTDYLPHTGNMCLVITITDFQTNKSCSFNLCKALPNCSTPCINSTIQTTVNCDKVDINGNYIYKVTLNLFYPGSSGSNIYIYSTQGSIASITPPILTNGLNTITFNFTDLPPANFNVCFQIYIYDPVTKTWCDARVCPNLPSCGFKASPNNSNISSLQHNSANILDVAPNPTQSITTISYNFDEAANNRIEIRDMLNHVVQVQIPKDKKGAIEINVLDLASGMYTIIAYNSDKLLEMKKLIVLK